MRSESRGAKRAPHEDHHFPPIIQLPHAGKQDYIGSGTDREGREEHRERGPGGRELRDPRAWRMTRSWCVYIYIHANSIRRRPATTGSLSPALALGARRRRHACTRDIFPRVAKGVGCKGVSHTAVGTLSTLLLPSHSGMGHRRAIDIQSVLPSTRELQPK